MRVANTAIIREPYQIPTLEEILHTFNGCTMFTTLDLNQGYHQISLDEQSRDLTAFASRRGILRYTRLIYGISSASEIYQREVEKALHGLEGVRNISDDIIIGGKTADELLNRTIQTLNRLRECNLTINKDKCKFFCEELVYMGHVLSRAGLSPDKSKVESIVSLKPPTNQKELRSFLGMITYCSKFIPNFTEITYPLRTLIKQRVPWKWTKAHQEAFEQLKSLLISSVTLAYYNPKAKTEVITDASPVGLGAVIAQQQPDGSFQPVCFASRALTEVEQHYSQIERESLGILFGVERFRLYLYGITFTVKTDHKPLVHIFTTASKPSPRIERWMTKLMPYQFKVEYQPGHANAADFLSRSNPVLLKRNSQKGAEEHIRFVAQTSTPHALQYKTFQEHSKSDKLLRALKHSVTNNNFSPTGKLSTFYPVRNCLSVQENVILYNNKIYNCSSFFTSTSFEPGS